LGPATGKRWAIDRVTLVRLMKHDLISEGHSRTLHRERPKLQRTLRTSKFPPRHAVANHCSPSPLTDHSPPTASSFFLLPSNFPLLCSFFSVFPRRDSGEQHDPGGGLSGSILP
jgi:hypothetical protein